MATHTFVPHPRLKRGHWMTVYCWAARRQLDLPSPEARLFQVAPDTQVLAHCYWQADRRSRPTLLALHGLEGSSTAHYMRGLAAQGACAPDFNAVLLNQRNCGGTEHLGPGLYHSGLTADAALVISGSPHATASTVSSRRGYSLGGNLAMKLAGEHPPTTLPPARGGLRGVARPRARRVRPRARAADRTSSISGTSCGT